MYKGLECVCFLAGPSLCEFEQEKIEKFCENKPVFSLKTSALKFNSITDVCITNHYATFNFPEKRDYIVLSRQETPLGYENWINPDLVDLDTLSNKFENTPDTLWGSDTTARHSRSVINANRWEENLFINSPYNRIIGPGIMNDMVVPLLVHLALKKSASLVGMEQKYKTMEQLNIFMILKIQYKPTLNYVSNKFNLNNLKSDTGECEQQIAVRGEEEVFKFLSSKNIELEI